MHAAPIETWAYGFNFDVLKQAGMSEEALLPLRLTCEGHTFRTAAPILGVKTEAAASERWHSSVQELQRLLGVIRLVADE